MVYIISSLLGVGMVVCFGVLVYGTIELGKIPRQVMSEMKIGKEAIKDKINN